MTFADRFTLLAPLPTLMCLSMMLAGLACPSWAANDIQSADAIRAAAQGFAARAARAVAPREAAIEASAGRLDARLRLAACAKPLEAFGVPGHRPGARMSIGVRCPDAGGWSLYVPVDVSITTPVVVLAAPAARGQSLGEVHLRLEERDVSRVVGGYLTRLDDALGLLLRRPMPVGTVLTSDLLERPKIVRRGQRVRLVTGASGYRVTAEGEALGDAAAGERLRVRNLRSSEVVEGVVDEGGRVLLGGAA